MKLINRVVWLLGVALLRGSHHGVVAQTDTDTDPGLSLVASSPFSMILRPTPSELDLTAMQVVENGITAMIMEGSSEGRYADVEVVLQQKNWVDNDGLPATRVRFFVLATIEQETDSSDDEDQSELDSLIESIFNAKNVQEGFLDFLTSEPLLQNVTQVVVKATVLSSPSTSDETKSTRKKLSTVDIILIIVSSAIFLGIAWMVIQHHKDRGYLENLRLHTINANPTLERNNTETGYDGDDDDNNNESIPTPTLEKGPQGNREQDDSAAPSTPSTTNSVTDVGLERAESPERPVRITTVTTSPVLSKPIISAASIAIQPMVQHQRKHQQQKQLVENFENNWFHRLPQNRPGQHSRRKYDGYGQDDEDNYGQMSSGESSEDLFHVDVDALCDDSVASVGEESKATASTSASAIAEWMKTIRVVPSSDAKTTGTNSTDSHGHSTAASYDASSSLDQDQSSLEQLSLEQSMASSSVEEQSPEIRRMEV